MVNTEITTGDILKKLNVDSDSENKKFFYLYISTSEENVGQKRKKSSLLKDEEQTKLKRKKSSPGQQKEDEHPVSTSDSDDSKSSDEDIEYHKEDASSVNNTENTSQSIQPVEASNPDINNNPSLLTSGTKKARRAAMNKVHRTTLPKVLYPHGWQKVHDKDLNISYRALFFGTFEKQEGESDKDHILRVGKYRKMVREEVEKVMEENKVKFKINSLLSRPLLYDEQSLEEQSLKKGSTHREQQTTLDDINP